MSATFWTEAEKEFSQMGTNVQGPKTEKYSSSWIDLKKYNNLVDYNNHDSTDEIWDVDSAN